ncbi:MAG TPA: polysaccharide deacetylase family protein [Ktedonobacteraceae bacterium]|nr:polysaccharide deacetylase family protein [Ktedonobacteraceae bacterium]
MLKQAKNIPVPILMYHSVSYASNPRFKQFAVTPAAFTEQMAYLSRHNYTPITVTQLADAYTQNGLTLPERPVVLTFDDGFADFLANALPVLQTYHFTATLYITTAFIDGTSRWLQHEGEASRPMLSWQDVSEIAASGIECGAHTHTHPQLDTLTASRAKNEIEQSKKLLEDHLGQEVASFAYPYGYFTAHVRQQVREAGFRSACAVKHAMSTQNDHPFSLARVMVSGDMDLEGFAGLITGQTTSAASALYMFYARARTPLWQLIRRNVATMKRYSHKQQKENLHYEK